jgi:hypothetical protein
MKPPLDPALKLALKEALTEALHDERGWLAEVVAEVLEDMALTEALREVEALGPRARRNGFGLVEGEA